MTHPAQRWHAPPLPALIARQSCSTTSRGTRPTPSSSRTASHSLVTLSSIGARKNGSGRPPVRLIPLCVAAQPTDCARLAGPSYANFWSPYRYSRYVQDGKHAVLVNGVSGYRTSRYVVTVYTCDGSEVEREVDSSDSARPLLTAPGLSLIVRQVGRDPSSSPSRVAVCYV